MSDLVAQQVSGAATPLSNAPCLLCPNGEAITLPLKEVSIPGFEFIDNCQTLAEVTPVLLQEESEACSILQSIGTLCGCPKKENACNLCSDGSKAEYGWRALDFLADNFGGVVPTCEIVEAGLYSYNDTDAYCSGTQMVVSEYCGCGAEPGSQPVELEEWQQCSLCHHGEPVPLPNKTIDIVGFPFQTCGQLAKATATLLEDFREIPADTISYLNSCSKMRQFSIHCGCKPQYESGCPICKVGNSFQAPLPDLKLDRALTHAFLPGMELSCGILANITLAWSSTEPHHSSICSAFQGMGTQCGCPLPEKPACEMCPHAIPEESMDLVFTDFEPFHTLTCGFLAASSVFMEDGDLVPVVTEGDWIEFDCERFQYGGFLCGCNDGMFTYWGANTIEKQKAAVWTQRTSAMLSLFGSIAILVHIARINKRKRQGMFYQIMMGLSFADVLSSIAWGLGPLPSPANTASVLISESDKSTRFFGSHGTDATCMAQGFLLHLGFMSILFNVALSYYFKLCVVNGWRDSSFTPRFRSLMLGLPVVIGIAVALGAIPFITSSPIGCTIGSYESAGGWAKLIGLFYIPYGPAFIYTPINTLYIYWKVRSQSQRTDKWRMSTTAPPNGGIDSRDIVRSEGSLPIRIISLVGPNKGRTASKMESQVWWQSFWYVVTFFVSYGIFLVVFPLNGYSSDSYWLYIVLAVLTPIQGFLNSCVFFRSHITKTILCKTKKRASERTSFYQYLKKSFLWWPIKSIVLRVFEKHRRKDLSTTATSIFRNRPVHGVLQASYFAHSFSSANLSRSAGEGIAEARSRQGTSESHEEEKTEEVPLEHAAGLTASTSLSTVTKSISPKPSLLEDDEDGCQFVTVAS